MAFKKELNKACRRIPRLASWLDQRSTRRYLRGRLLRYPDLAWEAGRPCPQARVEAGRIQVGHRLFVLGGYVSISRVTQRVDMFNLETGRWHALGELPEGVGQTHQGTAHDGLDHAYIVAGQVGGNCAPATAEVWAFQIDTHEWTRLPPLPEPRYMPFVFFRDGRIHCISGNKPDRYTGARDHWSLGVRGSRAEAGGWREEPPLPKPRTHTGWVLEGDELLVFGGQWSDVPPIEGDPEHACDFSTPFEEVTAESFAFHVREGTLRPLAPVPAALSHTEHAILRSGSKIIMSGGVYDRARLCDRVYVYDIPTDRWSETGRLPYPMKSKIAALHDDRLFIVTGQRSVSESDLRPHHVLDTVWHAPLPGTLRA